MSPIQQYIIAIRDHHPLGIKEQTHYPALANLLNDIGKAREIKPRIRCVMHPVGQNANLPDGGLFSATQFPRQGDPPTVATTTPERGVIEAKPLSADVLAIAQSAQVKSYLATYKQVLVTTYRDFLLVDLDPATNLPRVLERYALAASQEEFLSRAASPKAFADLHEERLTQFLTRVMLHPVPLEDPKLLAFFLASYARDAKARIDGQASLPALDSVKAGLEQSLGLSFVGPEGEAFFRSTLVQTLFYGVFSAWVLWHNENPGRTDAFDWHNADWFIHVPFIRALFEQVATKSKLQPLGLVEPLDWASQALSRVRRNAFFANFNLDHAVTYFYEPFLQHFDPQLRKQLGVWYTPPEIVQYMVERVDTVLREELDIADGLAAENVFVLDPCCGTEAYLVEVLKRIEKTHREEKGWDALTWTQIKDAATQRVYGFEILPAPFVITHLQLAMILKRHGAALSTKTNERGEQIDERAAVYLTNALTGWDPISQPKLDSPEFQEERDSAEKIKQKESIIVIIGNPPYNSKPKKGKIDVLYSSAEKASPSVNTSTYKKNLNVSVKNGGWGIKKFGLDDLYIRFFRLAERRIVQGPPGHGIVCFISNSSYVDDPSFVVMREKFLKEFDSLWIDNLNGDSRETGKLTPDGRPDPSVFSTESQAVGIRVGTAIGLFVRKPKREKVATVRYREFWGETKRDDLLKSIAKEDFNRQYTLARASRDNRLVFRPAKRKSHYALWPRITDLCAVPPMNGLMEKRGGALFDIDRAILAKRMSAYFSRELDWETYRKFNEALTKKQARFDPKKARAKALSAEIFNEKRILKYLLRPFDSRFCYYTGIRPVWNEPRPSLWAQNWKGNRFLMSRPAAATANEGVPFYCTSMLGDNDSLRGHAYYFPMQLRNGSRLPPAAEESLFAALGEKPEDDRPLANLSAAAREYLACLRITDPDASAESASLMWLHVLAIGFSPLYLAENASELRGDWPRTPLPDSVKILESSGVLGQMIAGILNGAEAMASITTGTIRLHFRPIAALAHQNAKPDFTLSADWGHQSDGVVMPGTGEMTERPYSSEEMEIFTAAARDIGLTSPDFLSLLGTSTTDIYLNKNTYWKNIPINVWNYHIGGYQVLKKWLSYRESSILHRPLTPDEVREFRDTARRLTALLLLTPQLNANYRAVKANTYQWPSR